MSREAFHNLLKRYLDGNCTPQEKNIVEQWYGMLDDEELQNIQEAELSSIDDKLWATINSKIDLSAQEAPSVELKSRNLWVKLAVAASLIGTVMVSVYFTGIKQTAQPDFLSSAAPGLIIK